MPERNMRRCDHRSMDMSVQGTIFDISRASLHDGQGIRTVIYLKGCSLQCRWCHNPEGIAFAPQLMFAENLCIKCGQCQMICPAHHTPEGYAQEGCTACGRCAEGCPNEALTVCGRRVSADEVLTQIRKDKHYFERSGGGVTFSGGECFLQPVFLRELAQLCHAEGIHTTAESALYFDTKFLNIAWECMDAMFADLKIMDSKLHRAYTGADNELILRNMRELSWHHKNVTVRIPMIPGVSDTDQNLLDSAEFLNSCGEGIRGVELLKYNNLAGNKYVLLQKKENVFYGEPQSDSFMEEKRRLMRSVLKKEIAVL